MNPITSATTVRRPSTEADTSRVWAPDLGNGHYRNPIICADYSDPDVVRHGDDYYLTASSFNCTPGLPILHSRDLVNWQIINHAVKNLPEPRYEQVQPGCGIWAPAIRVHDGKFWIFFPMPDEGIYVTTATDPAGQWTEPRLLQAGQGLIDPCPLWDDDGKAYLVHAYAHSRSGIKHCLRVCPMAPDASALLGEGQIVFDDLERHPTLEGPKFLKRDGWYYILAPAGGVATGWQVVLRSRNVYGPYEDRIVLEQGSTSVNGPHQGALIDTPGGQWWFIHFQDAGAYGRILHLQPVKWRDGWPLIGADQDGKEVGEPVLEHVKPDVVADSPQVVPQTSDEFNEPRLGPQWQWNANHREKWCSLTVRPGWARMSALPLPKNNFADAPHLLLQKFPAPSFRVTTMLQVPHEAVEIRAGLMVMGQSYAGLLVSRQGTDLHVEQISRVDGWSKSPEVIHDVVTGLEGTIWLRVAVEQGAMCAFSYSTDGQEFISLGWSFAATPGKWIGAKVGIIAAGENAYADFDFFRIE